MFSLDIYLNLSLAINNYNMKKKCLRQRDSRHQVFQFNKLLISSLHTFIIQENIYSLQFIEFATIFFLIN